MAANVTLPAYPVDARRQSQRRRGDLDGHQDVEEVGEPALGIARLAADAGKSLSRGSRE
jgi:hypothetical protein